MAGGDKKFQPPFLKIADEAARLRFCERVFVRFYLQKNRKKATAAS